MFVVGVAGRFELEGAVVDVEVPSQAGLQAGDDRTDDLDSEDHHRHQEHAGQGLGGAAQSPSPDGCGRGRGPSVGPIHRVRCAVGVLLANRTANHANIHTLG